MFAKKNIKCLHPKRPGCVCDERLDREGFLKARRFPFRIILRGRSNKNCILREGTGGVLKNPAGLWGNSFYQEVRYVSPTWESDLISQLVAEVTSSSPNQGSDHRNRVMWRRKTWPVICMWRVRQLDVYGLHSLLSETEWHHCTRQYHDIHVLT